MTRTQTAERTRPARVVDDLSFPTSVTFDAEGNAYVAESGLPFGGAPRGGRVWRIADDGARTPVAEDLPPPVNGLLFHEGGLYVSGGARGYILRIERDGSRRTILAGLPGPGNYHTNMVVAGPDGKLYFSQGALTNTGIVGLDAYELGWLRQLPHPHDIPGLDIVLTDAVAETRDPFSDDPHASAHTGAFAPFGAAHLAGTRLAGQLPCTAAVLRCEPDGSGLELVAWGIRNGYGMAFLPDGRLVVTDQGSDDRGSRPVGGAPDLLLEVRPGAWYGWPDFVGGVPITEFTPTRGEPPRFVLANHAELPAPEPALMSFPVNAAAAKLAVIPPGLADLAGQLVVALFGDERPMTAPAGPKVGRSLVRIDPADWSMHPLADGLTRPIDVAFGPDGALYAVDFGAFEMLAGGGLAATAGSGGLWRLEL